MCDYVKPEFRHQPNTIILHSGANDISNEINTLKEIKEIAERNRKMWNGNTPQVSISSLINRYNQEFNGDT